MKANIEAFALTPYEIPGVDSAFIHRKLNVNSTRCPIVQRLRRSALARTEAVVEEVDRLLKARTIREVQYPTWLLTR